MPDDRDTRHGDKSYGGKDFGGDPPKEGRDTAPGAPKNVRIKLTGQGGFIVSWKDLPAARSSKGAVIWYVRYTSADLAGPMGGSVTWPDYVYVRGTTVGTVSSSFSDKTISCSVFSPGLPDGWITVAGTNQATGADGRPSIPVLLNLSGNQGQIPDNTQTASLSISKERSPYDVVRLDAVYTPPADVTTKDYAGMHLHMVGYNAATDPVEIGSMATWDHGTGNQKVTYRLPQDSGQGTGVATFSNGSGNIVRVSGTNFNVGWVGRKIIIDESATSSSVYQISGFTDANHMAITPVFAGSNGNYTWTVLNNITFYFVSIGSSGARRPDYTGALSVAI